MLPDRLGGTLGDGDHQGVGQQPHHPRGLHPAHLFDPAAQGAEVERQDRLAGMQRHGAQDVGLGLRRCALHVDRREPEADGRQPDVQAVDQGRRAGLHPVAGEQRRGQADSHHQNGNDQGEAGAQADALGGAELGGGLALGARRLAHARSGAAPGGAGPGLRRIARTATHYRGHEASSTIQRTRSSYPIPKDAACSGTSEVGVMPGWVLTSNRTRTSLRSS